MLISADQLLLIAPNVKDRVEVLIPALNRSMEVYGIDSLKRIAHYLGQILVESSYFSATREEMNYSAQRLMMVWPKRFPTLASTTKYAHNPEALANFVYANRMGNGAPETGDGWKHRGAGWIQLTGKDNQLACAKELGIHVDDIGAWLGTVDGAAQSAAWFWWKQGCNRLADFGNVDALSDTINLGRLTEKVGDAEGYAKRVKATDLCKKVLKV